VLFVTHQTDPVLGTLVFVVEVGLSIWIVYLLRSSRYRPRTPSFKLVFFSLTGIALVCAFAGIEPLASCKDSAMSWASKQGHRAAESFNLTEPASGELSPAESAASEPASAEPPPAQEEATHTVAQDAQTDINTLEREVVALVNSERLSRNVAALNWDDELHRIAREHSQEMARRGELFHSSINEPYAENCWGGSPGSFYYFGADDIVAGWMASSKHRTWLVCPHLKHIAVGVAVSDGAMYVSWTFWRRETSYSDWWYMDDSNSPPEWWY